MSPDAEIRDVVDLATFGLLPPCRDPRFDHRSCDYWEDELRGAKSARPAWWQAPAVTPPKSRPRPDNPFAPDREAATEFNPFMPGEGSASDAFGGDDLLAGSEFNPFAPEPQGEPAEVTDGAPRKLRLLDRGRGVFGSYAKVLLLAGTPAAYTQFGPLSAYPRAQQIRELYPALPKSPLPAVITCVATTAEARGAGLGRRLVEAVLADLARRGFSAVEAYPDLSLEADEAPAATPGFWTACGFEVAAADERYPVMRRELA